MTNHAGVIGSFGIAIGTGFIYKPFVPVVEKDMIDSNQVDEHLELFARALNCAKQELEASKSREQNPDSERYKILDAHQAILEDEELLELTQASITQEHFCASLAVYDSYEKFIQILSNTNSPIIRERVADMRDVHNRIQRCMQGIPEQALNTLRKDSIIIAEELLPSDTISLDPDNVIGIVTERGGATSHTAIIASNFGIPALLGVKDACCLFQDGETIVLDALDGVVCKDLDDEQMQACESKRKGYLNAKENAQRYLYESAQTQNGEHIEIKVNIGSTMPEELKAADFSDGVGLFRSEFLYMESPCLPDEETQYRAYRTVLEAFREKPVVLRTLDIGGDKKLPYWDLPEEENPFLGKRALRLCLENEDIFETQLRAALRASVYGNLWIMFPMVSSVEDILAAKAVVKSVADKLDTEGVQYSRSIQYGAMIEVPAAAIIADQIADIVDFASIGTNDLCQYLTAADRMNPHLKQYYELYHPAMFRILENVIRNFNDKKKSISVCGEISNDPAMVVALVGLGLRSLSMSQGNVAMIKQIISCLSVETAQEAAKQVLNMTSADRIKKYLRELTNDLINGCTSKE